MAIPKPPPLPPSAWDQTGTLGWVAENVGGPVGLVAQGALFAVGSMYKGIEDAAKSTGNENVVGSVELNKPQFLKDKEAKEAEEAEKAKATNDKFAELGRALRDTITRLQKGPYYLSEGCRLANDKNTEGLERTLVQYKVDGLWKNAIAIDRDGNISVRGQLTQGATFENSGEEPQ